MELYVLLILALLPGIFLIYKIYKADHYEKEPIWLILVLIIVGAIMGLPAMILEEMGGIFNYYFFGSNALLYFVVENFLIVALVEEGLKYLGMKLFTWKSKAFDYRFDGIVYSVSVSLGFAMLENVLYVLSGGLRTALVRAVVSVPGHAIFGIYMGRYYGLAKYFSYNKKYSKKLKRKALWIPVVLHGIFDFILSININPLVFLVYIIILDIVTISNINKYSRDDIPMIGI